MVLNREDFINYLIGKGLTPDRFGHFKYEKDGRVFRYKMQKHSFRLEVQGKNIDNKNHWINLGELSLFAIVTFYFSKIQLNADGTWGLRGASEKLNAYLKKIQF